MDIEKPLEREFPLLAPEIAKKKIQPKGKKRDPNDDINFRGKIHFQKYLNYCRTVNPVRKFKKLDGAYFLTGSSCRDNQMNYPAAELRGIYN